MSTESDRSGSTYRARAGVVSTRVRDTVVILDQPANRYHMLNEVASDIWQAVTEGHSAAAVYEAVGSQYDGASNHVAQDVARQVEGFIRAGLIEESPASDAHAAAALRLPSYATCILLLTEIKLRLAMTGYHRTLEGLRRRVDQVPISQSPSLSGVRSVEYRLARAGALYPGRALCLEQSLALFGLLRLQGVDVRFRLGVRPHPFAAHAWVEYQGHPINDVSEHIRLFSPFPDTA